MRLEKTHYVIMKQGDMDINNETVFMENSGAGSFTNDILAAEKYLGRKSALMIKNDYDIRKNHGYESDMQIIPVKVTYEW